MIRRRLSIVFLLGLLIAGCSPARMFTRPEVAIRGVGIESVSLSGVNLFLTLEVTNPNRLDLTLRQFTYRLFLAETLVAEGEITNPVRFPSRQTVYPAFPIGLSWKTLKEAAPTLIDRPEVPYLLEGSLTLGALGGEWTVPIHREGTTTRRSKDSSS
jgi:LEA14-like dessication related protein